MKKLLIGLLPTIGIPAILALAFFFFGISFWGSFILFFVLQFPIYSIYAKVSEINFIKNKTKLEEVRDNANKKEFELFIRKTTPVVCPACKSVNHFHIEIDNERNVHKCEKCEQEIVCMVSILPVVPTKMVDLNRPFTVKDFPEDLK